MERTDFQNWKHPVLKKKQTNYETCKQTGNNGAYKENIPVNRNSLWGVQIIDLLDKDIIPTIINMFKELNKNISKELKENLRTMSHWVEY